MVLGIRQLAKEYGLPITHITEQSMHNKAIFLFILFNLICYLQDTADGEFSVVKTAISRYLVRGNKDASDFIEVKDAESVVKFCSRHLSAPKSRLGIRERFFTTIAAQVFLQRKDEALDKVKTLAGISSRYQYICEVF